jgi:hypothetical protein
VQFFDCYESQFNQKWSFGGHLVNGSKCLALSGSGDYNGSNAAASILTLVGLSVFLWNKAASRVQEGF